MRKIDPEFQDAARDLLDCTLSEVNVKPGYLEFVFMGPVYRTIVNVSVKIEFQICGGRSGEFEPDVEPHGPGVVGAGDFVLIRGEACTEVELNGVSLRMEFSRGSRVTVPFTDADFEPLRLLGLTGDRFDQLAFLHAL